jgi:hypothetical protein
MWITANKIKLTKIEKTCAIKKKPRTTCYICDYS